MRTSTGIRGLLSLIVPIALAACAGGPKAGPTANVKPLPPPAPELGGHYQLVGVGQQKLPVSLPDKAKGCSRQIDGGSLQLDNGRYRLTRSVTRRCNGLLSARTLDQARGNYGGGGDGFVLRSDHVGLFSRAQGELRGDRLIVTPASDAAAPMRFQRSQ